MLLDAHRHADSDQATRDGILQVIGLGLQADDAKVDKK